MNSICIILTDYQSINEELILKSFNKIKKSKLKKIYLIGCKKKFKKIFQKFLYLKKINLIDITLVKNDYINYLINITKKSILLFNEKKIKYIINLPLNKKKYIGKNFYGYTEFFSYYLDKKKNENMLLYSPDNFSVCPLTTHIELKNVDKKINKENLTNCVKNITKFYRLINKKVKISILGLNPHASIDLFAKNKDSEIIKPVVNFFKKKINIRGPVSADTAFNKTASNQVFIGMYHDQVLIPFKLINKFNGINITIGKKIIRLSPDHGVAKNKIGQIKYIDNKSFLECIKFCEKY